MPNYDLSVNAVEKGKPKGVVLLFGWLGSQLKHVDKYSEIYQQKNYSTVAGVADTKALMMDQRDILQEYALEAAKEVIKLLKASDNPDLPVIVHVFSGAGCIMLEQLTLLIMLGRNLVEKNQGSEEAKNIVALGEAIQRGGEVFDSSPAYLDIFTGIKAIGAAISNPLLRIILQVFFLFYGLYKHLRNLVQQELDRQDEHWLFLRDSDIAKRQAYVYSTKDELTDSVRLEEMIELRRKQPNAIITTKRFDDSAHCAHYVAHPKEYKAFLDEFLKPLSKVIEEQEKLEDIDPEFTDYELTMD